MSKRLQLQRPAKLCTCVSSALLRPCSCSMLTDAYHSLCIASTKCWKPACAASYDAGSGANSGTCGRPGATACTGRQGVEQLGSSWQQHQQPSQVQCLHLRHRINQPGACERLP